MGGKGQEPFLSDEAQEQVAEEVATGRFRTAGEIRDWIAEQYGVTYKVGGIYSLMHRLRCAPKVPRPIHAKTDQEQQASWKKGGSTKPLRKLG
jgi:transposase